MKKAFFTIISLLFLLYSCGTLSKIGQGLRYDGSSYNKVFQSAIKAVDDIDFLVVSGDIDARFIVIEKSVYDREGGEIVHRLNISITPATNGVTVAIISDKELPVIDDKNYLKEFVEALTKRAPAGINVSR